MTDERAYPVALAPRRHSKYWDASEVTFSDLVSWAKNPSDEKECGNYLLGELRGRRRMKNTVISRSAIQLDADQADEQMFEDVAGFPYRSIVHTTFNSAPDDLRLRIVLPLDRSVTPGEYRFIAKKLMEVLGVEKFDPGSIQPERYMFKPSASNPEWYRHEVNNGYEVNADVELEGYSDSVDIVETPAPPKNKRDPLDMPGVIGAFNRVYSIPEAIEEFGIPYEHAGDKRWQLVGAHGEAGVYEVTDSLTYSHHVNDPAYGVTCSAFDLVRIYHWGILDADTPPETPVNRLPSNDAALRELAEDPKVVKEMALLDFDGLEEDLTDDSWLMDLRRSPKTGRVTDEVHNWDLISANDPVLSSLWWDEIALSIKTTSDLPWRDASARPQFNGTDRAALAMHIERKYGVRPTRALVDDLVDMRAQQNRKNPLEEYLSSLEWDGTPRLEESLPGVAPTEYTRLVARKCLVAAVARVFAPGCKWDHTLILYGEEGLGKTHWVSRMSKGYTAPLGDIRSKDTLLSMQRSWIVTSDEGAVMKQADNDSLKEFLTRTEDVFRMPYEREVNAYPRHSVIWATTNDKDILRRQQGNRRYLIVHSAEQVDFNQLSDRYVDQVWAEAVHYYNQGEALFLDTEQSEAAGVEREEFTEEEPLSGLIQEWVNSPVPEGWDEMSPEARVRWYADQSDGFAAPGTERIDRICSMQVWVECLGRRRGDHDRRDITEITRTLRNLPGWSAATGRHRMPHYGPQLVFERNTK